MKEYHKIQTVFFRNPETKFKTLLEGSWAKPEFRVLSQIKWVFTEKIDGTNIRVTWDGENVKFGGKTDNAQIPVRLLDELQLLFPVTKLKSAELPPMTLYGEGYGVKIQKGGGNYIADGCSFILFDVFCGDLWLERVSVTDIAEKLSIGVVPVIDNGPLSDAIEIARWGFTSSFGDFKAEGLVMRPTVELMNRRGERVITKIKCKDFIRG
jgi:hypothetical protein